MPEVDIPVAVKETGMSKFYFYRLPKDTPGLYKYGRSLRINLDEFREWVRGKTKANGHPTTTKEEKLNGD
ncbi:MAG: hypothetical protein IH977_15310 [Nitrospinae bacterium]|nr:hypothetical protein [Nitrospinota bacterium]